jgi:diguanylate cyclase (GGDEF)-like protein
MNDPASAEPQPIPVQRPAARNLRPVFVLAPLVFMATAIAGMVLMRSHPQTIRVRWIILVMLAAVVMQALAGAVLHHVLSWRRPLRRLERALAELGAGDGAIDRLTADFDGPLEGLARQIHELLREVQERRAQIVRSDYEVRQRLAQRTDAMERTISSLKVQANRDPLTGLYNRRMFEHYGQAVVQQAHSAGASLCLVILDLDNFKLLNDTIGHTAGDEFLRSVGQLIRSTVRTNDLAFRYGGDEFVIVMPDTDRPAALTLSGRLASLINAMGRNYKLRRPLGVSIGMATVDQGMREGKLEDLLKEADRRLYEFKEGKKGAGDDAQAMSA